MLQNWTPYFGMKHCCCKYYTSRSHLKWNLFFIVLKKQGKMLITWKTPSSYRNNVISFGCENPSPIQYLLLSFLSTKEHTMNSGNPPKSWRWQKWIGAMEIIIFFIWKLCDAAFSVCSHVEETESLFFLRMSIWYQYDKRHFSMHNISLN